MCQRRQFANLILGRSTVIDYVPRAGARDTARLGLPGIVCGEVTPTGEG
jgi:hypothetical protein